jgi:multidrug efflux system outer membrane protein
VPPVPPAGLPSACSKPGPTCEGRDRPDRRQRQIGVAKAALFPSITLTGNFGRESKDLSQLFSAPSAVWSFGAGLTQPIFEGGRLRAQVDQVTAQQQQSLEATARRCRPPSAK